MDVTGLISAGGAGVLALVVFYLLSANRSDRKHYEEAVDRAERRADSAEERTRVAREIAEEARRARFTAEDQLGRERGSRLAAERNIRIMRMEQTRLKKRLGEREEDESEH